MSGSRDTEYTEYVAARLSSLRRLAAVLCGGDWQRADDLVQSTLARLYVHWGRVRAADHADAYARSVLVREFVHERRSGWAKRVSLSGQMIDGPAAAVDQDAVLDLRAAVAALPARQRATLVLLLLRPERRTVSRGPRLLARHGEEPDGPGAGLGAPGPGAGARRRPRRPRRRPARRAGRAPDLPGEAPVMIEQQIRDLFAETADGEPTPAQVDVPLARRRGGWAVLSIPVRDLTTLRHSPVLEAETLKIARNAQFGAATPHLLFAAKFTGLPGDWRLTDAHYYADSGKLHAEDYTPRTARSRFLWQTGDLGYWTDAAYVIARPVPGGGTCAGDGPGSTRRIEIINGLRVVVQRYTEQGQPIHDLCAAHINGFWFDVQEFGPHPSIGVTRLFRDHVHLLGRNPANWTRSPLG